MKSIFSIPASQKRVYGLDILRALAILFVVVAHGQVLLPKWLYKYHQFVVFDGISIFFVLSGFLIGGILIKTLEKKKASLGVLANFWLRRWFRTLPNYYFVLLLLTIIFYAKFPAFSVGHIKSYFIFSQNLFWPHPSFFPEAWSLSVEEWFYLVTPILLFTLVGFGKMATKKAIFTTAIFILVVVTGYRFYLFHSSEISTAHQWDLLFRKRVFTRLDTLMFGVLGAAIFYYYKTFWLRYRVYFFACGLILFLSIKLINGSSIVDRFGFYNSVFSFSTAAVATLFLLPHLSQVKSGKGVIYKLLTRISLWSYSMYLLNNTLLVGLFLNQGNVVLVTNKRANIVLVYLLFWILTILLSAVVYRYFEIPTTRLRDSKFVQKWLAKK